MTLQRLSRFRHAGSLLVAAICLLISRGSPARADLQHDVQERLRARIESSGIPPVLTVGNEVIHASRGLPTFYEQRAFAPAWTGTDGPLPVTDSLVASLYAAELDGLIPSNYHLERIVSTLATVRKNKQREVALNTGRLVDLELLLTDAFLIFGSHLVTGMVNPRTIDPEWFTELRERDVIAALGQALETGRTADVFNDLLPAQVGYRQLRDALARYRSIERLGGWPGIEGGPKMEAGRFDARVPQLRQRLTLTADLPVSTSWTAADTLYDDSLARAVTHFQRRHGLDPDGKVGPKTLAALNVPVEDRTRQIVLNLERWRWLPQELGKTYLLINIANFELDMVENERPVASMRVIVGRSYRRTPVFSDRMSYLVLNPYWNIPHNIAVQDILPAVRRDSDYLRQQGIRVYRGWGADAQAVDPSEVQWTLITAKGFNFRLRQDPGPQNALGRIKFMFPNPFNVYLHDTPARGLFAKTARDFSSGCIRVEDPLELALFVLRPGGRWTRQSLESMLAAGTEQTIPLPQAVPVHLLYWTAWADTEGTVNFRNDIYARDLPLDLALQGTPPDQP